MRKILVWSYVVHNLHVKCCSQLGIIQQVEKQCAHFYSVSITEEEARSGFVCRVQSSDKSKFKVCTRVWCMIVNMQISILEDSAAKLLGLTY